MSIAAIGADAKQVKGLDASVKGASQVAPKDIMGAIQRAATRTGVDFAYLVKKAATESSFNPTAQAKGSSARGLYQFINSTWLNTLDKHAAEIGRGDLADAITKKADGTLTVADPAKRREIMALRDDPEMSATMAAELASDNAETIKSKTGKTDVTGTDLYLAHFLGAGGATSLLSKLKDCPNAPACNVVPEAAAANRSVFYTDGGRARSVKEVYAHFADKFGDSKIEMAAGSGDATAVAGAQAIAMATLQNTKSIGFSAFTGSGDDGMGSSGLAMGQGINTGIDAMTSGGVGTFTNAASYTPAAAGSMSADGKVFDFAPQLADHNSMYYQLMLLDQKGSSI